jgi:hypothetical protein
VRALVLFGTLLKYIAGIAIWLIVFTVLQISCVFNMGSFVDGLWMESLHDGLVKNMIGNVAFRVSDGYGDYGCGDKYIYFVAYRHSKEDTKEEFRSLSSLIDVTTWREVEDTDESSITTIFRDSKYEYVLHLTSDGADMSAVDL